MVSHIYKAASPNLPGGSIYISYKHGQLQAFDLADVKLTPEQLTWLVQRLPVTEASITTADLSTLVITPIPNRTAKDKIKMFCAAYRDFRGVTYQPTQKEAANVVHVPVSAELLRTFFECPLLDFTIFNYVKRINITKDFLKNGRELSKRLPNHFDKEFYKNADGPTLVAYRQHLKNLGWVYDSPRNIWKDPGKVS